MEGVPIVRPEPLDGRLAIVEPIGDRGPARRPLALGDGHFEAERLAPGHLAGRPADDQVGLLGPLRPAVGAEEAGQRDPACGAGRRGEDEGRPQGDPYRRRERRPAGRAGVDDLAEVDRLRLLQGLLDGRPPHRRGAEIIALGAGRPEELEGRGEPIVQARPAPLDLEGDVQVAEPDEEGAQDVPEGQVEAQAGDRQQEDEAHLAGEMGQPVGHAGEEDRGDQAADHPAQAVQGEGAPHPTPQRSDPRFQGATHRRLSPHLPVGAASDDCQVQS